MRLYVVAAYIVMAYIVMAYNTMAYMALMAARSSHYRGRHISRYSSGSSSPYSQPGQPSTQ